MQDDDNIQKQVKLLSCAVNMFRGTFALCSPAVITLYFVPFHANLCLPIVEQINTN